jgi:hypothetical protein
MGEANRFGTTLWSRPVGVRLTHAVRPPGPRSSQAGDILLLNAASDFWTSPESQANFRQGDSRGGPQAEASCRTACWRPFESLQHGRLNAGWLVAARLAQRPAGRPAGLPASRPACPHCPQRAPSHPLPPLRLACSNVGKAGTVKSSHEFLLPMVVTGRGGKVMLAGAPTRPLVSHGFAARTSALRHCWPRRAASTEKEGVPTAATSAAPPPPPKRRQDAGQRGPAPAAGRHPDLPGARRQAAALCRQGSGAAGAGRAVVRCGERGKGVGGWVDGGWETARAVGYAKHEKNGTADLPPQG